MCHMRSYVKSCVWILLNLWSTCTHSRIIFHHAIQRRSRYRLLYSLHSWVGDSWHSLKIIHPRYRGWSGSNKKKAPLWGWGPIHSNVMSRDLFGAFDSISGIKLPKNSHLDYSCVFFICTDDFTWVPRIPGPIVGFMFFALY